MVVISLEKPPASIRGELTRWFVEVKANVFVGNVNARVRDLLWGRICASGHIDAALMIYSCNNEQGYAIKMFGDPKRRVVDFDGVQLIQVKD